MSQRKDADEGIEGVQKLVVAKMLGMSFETLSNRMRELNIDTVQDPKDARSRLISSKDLVRLVNTAYPAKSGSARFAK